MAAALAGCAAQDPSPTQLEKASEEGWVRVPAAELHTLMSGATQKYDSFVGPGTAYFAADGSAKLDHGDGAFVAAGRWWVGDEVWCVVWGDADSPSCEAVMTKNGVYRSFDERGRFSSEFVLEDGNADAL